MKRFLLVCLAALAGGCLNAGVNIIGPGGAGGTGAVSSVYGRSGAVTAQTGDYTAAQVGAVATNGSIAGCSGYTLQQALSGGNNAGAQAITNFTDLQGTGRRVTGTGMRLDFIDATSKGAEIEGVYFGGLLSIGSTAHGASMRGSFASLGAMSILSGAYGSTMNGAFIGSATVGNAGGGIIGFVPSSCTASNMGYGALQLLPPEASKNAVTALGADASLMLGYATITNKESIVVGTGQQSHGVGSITAGGGVWDGNNRCLTNVTVTPGDIAAAGGVTGAQVTNMLTAAAWAPSFTNSAMTDGVLTILPANGNLQILAPTGGTTLVTFGGATTNLFSMITLCVSNPSLYTIAWSNAIGNTAVMPTGTNYHTFTFAAPYPGGAWSFMGGL